MITNNDTLRIAKTARNVTTLGPFNRFCIWVQGCKQRCPGCISPEMQPMDGGFNISVSSLAKEILSDGEAEGITISGGEPFLQDTALCVLIDTVRQQKDLGVIVYTGFMINDVINSPLLMRCDAVIDGNYVQSLNDGKSLRGSSNQMLWHITDRYIAALQIGLSSRFTQIVHTDQGSISMVGVPSEQDIVLARQLRILLNPK